MMSLVEAKSMQWANLQFISGQMKTPNDMMDLFETVASGMWDYLTYQQDPS